MKTLYYAIPFCNDKMIGPYDSEDDVMSDPNLLLFDDMWPVAIVEVEHNDFMGCDTIVRGWMAMRDDDLYDKARAEMDGVADRKRGRRWMYPPTEDEGGTFKYDGSVQQTGAN